MSKIHSQNVFLNVLSLYLRKTTKTYLTELKIFILYLRDMRDFKIEQLNILANNSINYVNTIIVSIHQSIYFC